MRNRAFKPATSACGSYGINEPLCLPAASGRLRALPLAALINRRGSYTLATNGSGDFYPRGSANRESAVGPRTVSGDVAAANRESAVGPLAAQNYVLCA
ncbi:MAG: hypothetical protein IK077_16070, partial [Thermoguttaceae bacterium]|nr:hypothetical protein [Thermoguttaceae bacterium]